MPLRNYGAALGIPAVADLNGDGNLESWFHQFLKTRLATTSAFCLVMVMALSSP